LHKGTNYGPTNGSNTSEFVRRVRVDALTQPMIDDIRDETIKQLVRNRLIEHGIDPDKKGKIPPAVFKEPLTMASGVPVRKVRVSKTIETPIMFADKNGNDYRAVVSGNNHHVEIIEENNSNDKTIWKGIFVNMMEATRRTRCSNKPLICKNHGDNKKFIMSLSRNEMVFLQDDTEKYKLNRVQKMSVTGTIIFRPHTYSGLLKDTDKPPIITRKSAGTLKNSIIKITIDPIGRIHKAND